MVWLCDTKRNQRQYANPDERKAFNAGYSDGFYNYPMWSGWSGNERDWYPNAYSAGFWEGRGDR